MIVSSRISIPPVSSPSPKPIPAAVSRPVRLLIPALGVEAAVEDVGLDPTGAMDTPHNLWNVGWFSPGPVPGAAGDAVIDGHVGLPGNPLIFSALTRLRIGDQITVIGADGGRRDFAVRSAASWPADSHPPGLFESTGQPRLTLITCGGAYLRSSQTYADRLVVEAVLSG